MTEQNPAWHLALWAVVSIVAVGLVGAGVAVAIAAALLGGAMLGLLGVAAFSPSTGSWHAPSAPAHAAESHSRSMIGRIAWWIDSHDTYLILASAPLFLFPSRAFGFVVALAPILAAARWIARGYLSLPSPLNAPIVALLVMLGPSLVVAPDPDLAFLKFAGILFGVCIFFSILNSRSRRTADAVSLGLLGIAVAISIVALVGTDWVGGKLSVYADIYQLLPRLIHNVPRTVRGGINPNEVGGVLAWLVPFLAALWLKAEGGARFSLRSATGSRWWRPVLVGGIALSSGVLFLTQSRAAIGGVTAALLVLVAIHWRAARWALLAAAVVATIGLAALGAPGVAALFDGGIGETNNPDELNYRGRVVIWQEALAAIRQYPLAGSGLNNFDVVRGGLGLESPAELAQRQAVHAHNLYLQAAVDFGLPGLVAYMALLTATFVCLLALTRGGARQDSTTMAAALFAGLFAHQIFGLTDAVTLGARPGFIFWAFLGLTGWLYARKAVSGMVAD